MEQKYIESSYNQHPNCVFSNKIVHKNQIIQIVIFLLDILIVLLTRIHNNRQEKIFHLKCVFMEQKYIESSYNQHPKCVFSNKIVHKNQIIQIVKFLFDVLIVLLTRIHNNRYEKIFHLKCVFMEQKYIESSYNQHPKCVFSNKIVHKNQIIQIVRILDSHVSQ